MGNELVENLVKERDDRMRQLCHIAVAHGLADGRVRHVEIYMDFVDGFTERHRTQLGFDIVPRCGLEHFVFALSNRRHGKSILILCV